MGAAASVWGDLGQFTEIATALNENLAIKKKIALSDGKIIKKNISSVFKDHKMLILSMTSRTKSQLQTLLTENDLTRESLQKLGGGLYGKFLANLATNSDMLNALAIDFATSGIGCDESGLANIFGCMTSKDISAMIEAYQSLHSNKLKNTKADVDVGAKLAGKLGKDSEFSKFVSRVLKADRYEKQAVDVSLAAEQAKIIHEAGVARSYGMDVEAILDILCYASREQCCSISEQYSQAYSMTLEKAITKKFSGGCAKALVLWTKPIPAAVFMVLNNAASSIMADSATVESTISKFDKPLLDEVDEICRKLHKKGLYPQIERAVGGNLATAVRGWLRGHTPDDGFEGKLMSYVDDKRAEGWTFVQLLSDPEAYGTIKGILADERASLLKYFGGSVHIDPSLLAEMPVAEFPVGDDAAAYNYSAEQYAEYWGEEAGGDDGKLTGDDGGERSVDEGNGSLVVVSPEARAKLEKLLKSSSVDNQGESYERDYKSVSSYLTAQFRKEDDSSDDDGMGVMSSDDFWCVLKTMPLSLIGFTEDEIEAMRTMVAWDNGGEISYQEALVELTEGIVNSIYNQGMTVEDGIAAMITAATASSELSYTDTGAAAEGDDCSDGKSKIKLPPDLLQYLEDSFEAYDVNSDAGLDKDEFWNLLRVMNLGLRDSDEDDINAKFASWDTDGDGHVDWHEALEQFNKIIHDMASDSERDHWIGLFDKNSQHLFWYNVRDKSSQWMTEAEQIEYRATNPASVPEDTTALLGEEPVPQKRRKSSFGG